MKSSSYAPISQTDNTNDARADGGDSPLITPGYTYPPTASASNAGFRDDTEQREHSKVVTGESLGINRNGETEKQQPMMPHVYYDDGPFDAPSSESEEETLLEKMSVGAGLPGSPGTAERGLANGLRVGEPKRRTSTLRCLLTALGLLLGMAVLIGVLAAHKYTGSSSTRVRGARHITMDHVFNGTFYVSHTSLRWVPEAGDGVHAEMVRERGVIQLVDLKTNSTRDLVSTSDIKNEEGFPLQIAEWYLSPDMKYMLIKADYLKQWRHSSFGNYYVHDIVARSTRPMIKPAHPPTTAYAVWSPTGEAIAFVQSNDLYVLPNASPDTKPIRITTSGTSTTFNGVPDWVYEEEVLSTDFALWWSPDSRKVAFLSLDEHDVPEYSFPVYNPSYLAGVVKPYPDEVVMRYPKPGFPNPIVDVKVFDLGTFLDRQGDDEWENESEQRGEVMEHLASLSWSGRQAANESIVFDVAWVGPDDLLVKEVNRAADDGAVVHFDTHGMERSVEIIGKVVRKLGKNGEEADDGWIESRQSITPLPPALITSLSLQGPAYLDLVNNSAGYLHVALFSPADSHSPVFVSDGEWEVVGDVLGVNSRGIVYFEAAYPSSIERTIFAAPIPASSRPPMSSDSEEADVTALTPLTDATGRAWNEASFSPQAGYYLLSYRGPNVPWQSVFMTGVSKDVFELKITNNQKLNETVAEYQSPLVEYSTIESDGYELNYMSLLPPGFDDTGRTQYPVLFRVYGGPNSQLVNTQFVRDWHTYLTCSLKYIVVVVDGRGTCCKGRKMRNWVKGKLGETEVRDQVEAARIWASKPFVDPKKIGIWGWSYGGFMTSKVVEADAGIHSLGMAVAPVTDWLLYDSIYTERYMSTPLLNPSGYASSAVSNTTGFRHTDFLLAHGSGDDNVHFSNSARLLDILTADRTPAERLRFRMFTDSDHSMGKRGGYRALHEYMTNFLVERWGKGGTRRSW